MIRWAAALGLLGLAGCTTVKLVQKEGCWVRRTEKWPGRITEELGPCTTPDPPWSSDRATRAMQECVARVEHRWEIQAHLAWSQGEPLPPPPDNATRACMEEPAKVLAGDNDELRRKNEDMQERMAELARERDARLADLTRERDALRSKADEERTRREASQGERLANQERLTDRLLTSQEKVGDRLFRGQDTLATYLGDAAKKSSQPAVATATATSDSDGSATTDSASKTESAATTPAVSASPAAAAKPAAARSGRRAPICTPQDVSAGQHTASTASLTRCEPAPAAPPAATMGALPDRAPQAEVAAAPAESTPVTPSAGTESTGAESAGAAAR